MLNQRIREERTRLDLTQEQMAKALSVSRVTVGKWERGAVNPKSKMIAAMAALSMDVSYILTGNRQPPQSTTINPELHPLLTDFELILLRLKKTIGVKEDQEVATLLGMSKAAFSGRKRSGTFPIDKMFSLKVRRPDLHIDEVYVLTGNHQPPQSAITNPEPSFLLKSEFKQIMLRAKVALNVETDDCVAYLLGMKKTAMAERKRRNSFPTEKFLLFVYRHPQLGIDPHWVLTGEHQPTHPTRGEHCHAIDPTHQPATDRPFAGGDSRARGTPSGADKGPLCDLAQPLRNCSRVSRRIAQGDLRNPGFALEQRLTGGGVNMTHNEQMRLAEFYKRLAKKQGEIVWAAPVCGELPVDDIQAAVSAATAASNERVMVCVVTVPHERVNIDKTPAAPEEAA